MTERPHTGLSPDVETRLDRMVQDLVADRGIHHAIVALGRSDGTPLWTGAAGPANETGAPMTAETPHFLASVTKLYIATATLRLVEQGRVSLDAPMSAYLPGDLVAGLHVSKGVDRTGEITVRHLLGHATGLPDYLVIKPRGGTALFDSVGEGTDAQWGIEEIAALLRDHGTPEFAPPPFDGRRHTIRYSDTNFQFLIAIIKAVTGASLQDAFDALIFSRLGLENTFLPGTHAAAAAAQAPAEAWLGDQRLDGLTQAMRSFNDLYGTTNDLLRFMAALVDGTAFEDPATARLMTAHWNPLAFSLSLRPVGPGWPMEYGLGMTRVKVSRWLTPLRPIPEMIGHTGVTGSWVFHCPELDVITAGTVDQATAAALPYRFVPRLLRLIREA